MTATIDTHEWLILINMEAITPDRIDLIQRIHLILAAHSVGPKSVAEVNLTGLPGHLLALVPLPLQQQWPLIFHASHFVGHTADELHGYLKGLESPESLETPIQTYVKEHTAALRTEFQSQAEHAESSGDLDTASSLRSTLHKQSLVETAASEPLSHESSSPTPEPAPSLSSSSADPHFFPLANFWFHSKPTNPDASELVEGLDYPVIRTGFGWQQQSRRIRVGKEVVQRVDPKTHLPLGQYNISQIQRLLLKDKTHLQVFFKSPFQRSEFYTGYCCHALALSIQASAKVLNLNIPLDFQ